MAEAKDMHRDMMVLALSSIVRHRIDGHETGGGLLESRLGHLAEAARSGLDLVAFCPADMTHH
jgi:hypothetical protein